MATVGMGDLLKISGIRFPVIVVSNNFFNRSGNAMVCPIMIDAQEGPLHIPISSGTVQGYVLCEQVRFADLNSRHYVKIGTVGYFDAMDISDAVMGIFDYQQL